MIELVVFDMAGTTVYDGDAVLHSLQAALPKRSWRLRSLCFPESRVVSQVK